MVHPHTAVKGLASYTTESGCLPLSFIRCHVVTTLIRCHVLTHSFIISIVRQMSCCDCILSSPLSFIRCHVVTAFSHRLYHHHIVGIWFNSSLSLPAIHVSSPLLCSLTQCLHRVMQAPSHELTGVRGHGTEWRKAVPKPTLVMCSNACNLTSVSTTCIRQTACNPAPISPPLLLSFISLFIYIYFFMHVS